MGISSRWVDQDREADAFFPNDPEPVVEAKKTPNFLSERLLKVVLPFQDCLSAVVTAVVLSRVKRLSEIAVQANFVITSKK